MTKKRKKWGKKDLFVSSETNHPSESHPVCPTTTPSPHPNYSNYIRFVVDPLAAIAALRL